MPDMPPFFGVLACPCTKAERTTNQSQKREAKKKKGKKKKEKRNHQHNTPTNMHSNPHQHQQRHLALCVFCLFCLFFFFCIFFSLQSAFAGRCRLLSAAFFFWLQEALSTDEISLGFVFLPVFTAAQPYKTQTKQHKVQTLHRCLIEALLLLNVCVCAYVFVFVCVRACMLFDLLIFETSNLSFFPFLFRFLIPLLACFVLFCFTITSLRDVAFFESEAREWCRMCLL